MLENGSRSEGLLVRAEPLELAEELSRRMVKVERTIDGALLLEADPEWADQHGAGLEGAEGQ